MIHKEERSLMVIVLGFHGRIDPSYWDQLSKQDKYYLEKWSRKRWWNYGVSLRSGWLEKEGFIAFLKAMKE